MINSLLIIIWFFLPAALANSTPVLAAKLDILKKLNYPVDLKKQIGGIRILGDHKTFRGLFIGISVAIFVAFIQKYLYLNFAGISKISVVNYAEKNMLVLGLLLGGGALLGDMLKSFFKRRLQIKPGKAWFPFDQIDYILGVILLSYWYVPLSASQYLLLVIVFILIHIVSNLVAYLLKIKDVPY